jgi:hypothetical protein
LFRQFFEDSVGSFQMKPQSNQFPVKRLFKVKKTT